MPCGECSVTRNCDNESHDLTMIDYEMFGKRCLVSLDPMWSSWAVELTETTCSCNAGSIRECN